MSDVAGNKSVHVFFTGPAKRENVINTIQELLEIVKNPEVEHVRIVSKQEKIEITIDII